VKKRLALTFAVLIVGVIAYVSLNPNTLLGFILLQKDEDALISCAVLCRHPPEESGEVVFPTWIARLMLSFSEIDLSASTGRQSRFQLILTNYSKDHSAGTKRYIFQLAEKALDAGADIDHIASYGLTALHESVLNNSPTLANFLIKHGASCGPAISREGRASDGMTALEFARFLQVSREFDNSEMIGFLDASCANT
jgi:hypothetical protein